MHLETTQLEVGLTQNETYGLNSDWQLALQIFDRKDISCFLELINVFQIQAKVTWLGTVLNFLSKPRVHEQLDIWSNQCLQAKKLLDLSCEIYLYRGNLTKYKPLLNEQAASTQVRGELSIYFLFALILQRMPPVEKIYQDWFDDLRLWMLVQALIRAQTDNYLDEYIKFAADKIRLASEKLDDWLDLLKKLKPFSSNFSDISSYLAFQCDQLINNNEGLSASHKSFLKQLKYIATGQQKPSNLPVSSPIKVLHKPSLQVEPLYGDLIKNPNDDGYQTLSVEEGELISAVNVDADKSFARQRLSSNSIILKSIIDSQNLPWRWNNLSSYECAKIDNNVQNGLLADDLKTRLISCFAWFALNTGRTIRRVTEFKIDKMPHEEWTLSHDFTMLFRLPPHRKSDWQPTIEQEIKFVLPVAQYIKIGLPVQIQELLSLRQATFPNAQSLGELWDEIWDKPEKEFNDFVKHELPRITSGMLDSVLSNHAYAYLMDDAITSLIVSHPQSGLPAACAYANYTLLDAKHAPSNLIILPDADSTILHSNIILFGSRLDVVEDYLVDIIKKWDLQYEEYVKEANFVNRHNAYIAYIVLMLMAATAIRNVRDPFESIQEFDFENHFLFLDDKVLSQQGSGRLVPLPKSLSNYIQTTYLSHLAFLSKTLTNANPKLCEEINAILSNKPTGGLPFFFFLNEENGLDWNSVSGAAINSLGIFEMVFPFNMFRHRLAKDLRRRGVSSEIVSGLLGHADANSEPYGDFSHRVWLDDVMHAKPAIDASFKSLPFQFKKFDRIVLDIPSIKIKQSFNEIKQFGAAARKQARLKHVKEALRLVRYDIENFLAGTTVDLLSEEEFDQLSKRMIFHENGIPRTYGYLRYEYLMRKVERLWNMQGKKVKIKRRYVSTRSSSIFSAQAPIALSTVKQLRILTTKIVQALNLKKINTALFAITPIIIMLETKYSDIKSMMRVLHFKSFRLVCLDEQFYWEFADREYFDDDTPIRRIKISESLAYLLSLIQENNKSWQHPKEIPQLLEEMAYFLSIRSVHVNDYEHLLKSVAHFVDQVNCIQLEGIRAGYLAGRVESYALNLFDWIKLRIGKKVLLNQQKISSSNHSENAQENRNNVNILSSMNAEKAFNIKDARDFFKALRKILNEFNGSKLHESRMREATILRVKALNKEKAALVSSSVLILGGWVVHLLEKKIRDDEYLRLSSIERYLSELSPYFTDIAFDIDIFALDDEDITLLYDEMLKACPIYGRDYLSNRLVDFDAYATTQDVESPDWSEVSLVKLSAKVAPGIISNDEYHQALHLILKSKFDLPITNDAICAVLIFCYRFGLRAKEALGLLRSDLINTHQPWTVLVQTNKYRSLKNKGSRRQVPLLFNLLKIEEEILARHLAQCESVFGKEKNTLLFYSQQRFLTKSEIKLVQSTINQILKFITSNHKITLHHCRHTAINRIALDCIDEKLDGWKGRGFSVANGTKESLLSNAKNSRRISWATANYLGHVIRETQYRNYIHFLPDWCDLVYDPLPILLPKPSANSFINVNQLPEMNSIEFGLITSTKLQHIEVGAIEVLKYYRLLALGRAPDDALAALNISEKDGRRLNDVLNALFLHTTVKNVKAIELLKMIKESAWKRLLNHLQTLDIKKAKIHQKYKNKCNLSLEDIGYMIGSTRQILLWKKEHFRLFGGFLKSFAIEPHTFKLIAANKAGQDIVRFTEVMVKSKLCQQMRFAEKGYQLDAVYRNGNLTLSKAAIIATKNNILPIRNSYELVMMFSIYVSLVMKSGEFGLGQF